MNKQTRRHGYIRAFAVVGVAAFAIAAHAADDKPLGPNVVARQGGVEVTLKDVDAAADKIPEGDRAGYFDSPKRIESTLGSLLYQKQLAFKARAQKLDKDPLVQLEIAQATDDVLARVQLEHYRKSLKLPDFEVLAKEYYASHKDEFVESGNLIAEHVVVSTKNRSEDDAKARIGEVEAAARAHPDQFADLVEKYSDDPNKANNHGRIALASSNDLTKPFAKAVSALKTPGEISPVVKTDVGYQVIKLIEKKPDRQRTFDEIHTDLLLSLRRNFIATQLNQYTGEIRGNPVQANPDLVASLRTRYGASGIDTIPSAQSSETTKPADGSSPPAH